MDIISRDGELVNIISSAIPTSLRFELSALSDRWSAHKSQCGPMADRLAAAGFPDRAWRVAHCGERLFYRFCAQCGARHIYSADLCRDRFCPVCSWRLSMRRFSVMVGLLDALRRSHPRSEWGFVTLTVKNCSVSDLSAVLDQMSAAWNKIMRRRGARDRFLGWARSLEMTWNAEAHEVHPHYHVLCLMAPGYQGDDSWLPRSWCETVELVTHIQAQDAERVAPFSSAVLDDPDEVARAVLETFKYTIKSNDLRSMPLSAFRDLVGVLRGRRMVAFGGCVREYASLLRDLEEPEEEDARDDSAELVACARCGSLDVIRLAAAWTGDGYLWRRVARF